MTENAKRYNVPQSVIYKDACKLKRLAKETCARLGKLMQQGNSSSSVASTEQPTQLIEQLSEMTQTEFSTKLAEAEAEAAALAAASTPAPSKNEKAPVVSCQIESLFE